MARPRSCSHHRIVPLTAGWQVAAAAAGAVETPDAGALDGLDWIPASAPGTVALAQERAGRWTIDDRVDFDDHDWWYRLVFDHPLAGHRGSVTLRCGGLATLADVWLNDTHVLHSENMFRGHEVEFDRLEDTGNVLVIRCASVNAWLAQRRPRPAWRTRVVKHQQLRWLRTSLIGRIPAWMPQVAPVGPWRPVDLVVKDPAPALVRTDLRTTWTDGGGSVTADVQVEPHGVRIDAATLVIGTARVGLEVQPDGEAVRLAAAATTLPDVAPWWPHTHGTPALYDARIEIESEAGEVTFDLGRLGFRSIAADTEGGGFGILVNGVPVFARGGCWVTADPVGLAEDRARCEETLRLARDAGMNMIRIVGTATYGSEELYDLCDALGILVWQDFPFANMDYPGHDADFRNEVTTETHEALERLQSHPSLTVLCGGSEVFQQAAMLGLTEDAWRNPVYDEILPHAIGTWCGEVPYVASSPDGGALPFHVSTGVAHYFGVGAYLRPLADARHSAVGFTSECLGLANVPEPSSVEAMAGGTGIVHDPRWKARVPRDGGAGWDFEDVRDHYFRELFALDPSVVRYHDPERYLALSRVVSGEVMASAFAEWRRDGSTCRGALVWFLRDFWLGAGWGTIDALDVPKACYYYLRRVCAPLALMLTEEGMNGLTIHGVNDGGAAQLVTLEVRLLREDGAVVAEGSEQLEIPARGGVSCAVDELLGRFTDAAWIHRFGPPNHDVVAATARQEGSDAVVGEAYYFVKPLIDPTPDEFLEAHAEPCDGGAYDVTVTAARFARAVSIDAPGYRPEDNYFNLQPQRPRTVRLRPAEATGRFKAHVGAINAMHDVRVKVHAGGDSG